MAIRWKIKRLAEVRDMNISQVADATGMAYSSVLDYWHGRARRIDLKTLEKFCKAFDCTPCEIFEYLPNIAEDDIEEHEPMSLAPQPMVA